MKRPNAARRGPPGAAASPSLCFPGRIVTQAPQSERRTPIQKGRNAGPRPKPVCAGSPRARIQKARPTTKAAAPGRRSVAVAAMARLLNQIHAAQDLAGFFRVAVEIAPKLLRGKVKRCEVVLRQIFFL